MLSEEFKATVRYGGCRLRHIGFTLVATLLLTACEGVPDAHATTPEARETPTEGTSGESPATEQEQAETTVDPAPFATPTSVETNAPSQGEPGVRDANLGQVGDAAVGDADATFADQDAAPDVTTEDPAPTGCTGKRGVLRGKSGQSVMAGGLRTFVYYAPEDLDPNEAVPLVIVPHGYTQSGEAMFDITRYSDVADRERFVVMFPDGAPGSVGPWDVGGRVCGNGSLVPGSGDDQLFIDEMIAFAEADQCLDKEHIFMTGWSMGGYLSNHSGCLREDLRAIGPHSGGSHDLSECPVGPKPVILFHFDPDGLIDYRCGVEARDRWVAHNGCSLDNPEVRSVKGGNCEYYAGCPADGQVAFCTFEIPPSHRSDFLAGHAWSGGTTHSYSIEQTESAAELGWAFFKAYAW